MAQYITFTSNPSDMSRNLWQAWWAWVICFVVTIAISLATVKYGGVSTRPLI